MEPDHREQRYNRPSAFDKMEGLVRSMQDTENGGVPVRNQNLFYTTRPAVFMGYDLIEWLMERLGIEESEALNLANQLCQYGYFFPVRDPKNLVVKDDSSLYRFQAPYYWPWQNRPPDNVEYAIYLVKRTLRNRQRHGLEEYEQETLNNLSRNLASRWNFITLQAEEQVRLAQNLRREDKIIADSQERAYWRVHRPPPGMVTSLEQCPVPTRSWNGQRTRRRTLDDCKREVELLERSLSRTRVKVSQALESMIQHVETYTEYDPLITPTQPSNPWVTTDDVTFWHLNSPLVEVATEKRVRRWALSMEDLVSDPTGLQEFTNYLRKEYSHENIRFWSAVNDLRRSAQSQIQRKVNKIFEEFLAPGAPCEINIDGKTMEKVHQEMKNPSRFTFDAAQDHVYTLLLKKDCYPRFIRSEYYKSLLANGVQPSQKKRLFGFGQPKKKVSTTNAPSQNLLQQQVSQGAVACGALSKRRGSDRSLSGSAHELAVSGIKDSKVPHSHSQSNLSDIPYRVKKPNIGVVAGPSTSEEVCPWEAGPEPRSRKNSGQSESSSSDVAVADISEGVQRTNILTQQHTVDGGGRQLVVNTADMPRRASVSVPIAHSSDPTAKRKVFSFEDNSTAGKSPVFGAPPAPASTSSALCDVDNNSRTSEPNASSKTLKKSHSIAKTCSNAPIISVSSVADDDVKVVVGKEEVASEDEATSGEIDMGSSKSQQQLLLTIEPLAPLAEPDSESPASELPPSVVAAIEDEEARSNDVCPWEDETCRVDTPYVKTYATLGYL